MNQAGFLKKLRRQLWWRLPPQEVEAVLADYGEYFENGLAAGKSEEALCTQFGEPRAIAIAVTEERGSRYYATTLVCMALCGGLLLLNVRLTGSYGLWESQYLLYGGILFLSALSICFGSKMTGSTAVNKRNMRWIPWLHLILLPLVVLLIVFIWNAEEMSQWALQYVRIEQLGPMASRYILLVALLATVLWLADVVYAGSGSRWRLVLIPVNATVLALMVGFRILLNTMSDISLLHQLIRDIIYIALPQLLPLLLIPFLRKRGDQ